MLDTPTVTTSTAAAMMLEHLGHTETINVSAAVKKGNLVPHSFLTHILTQYSTVTDEPNVPTLENRLAVIARRKAT
ncbi:hypothetical protein GGI42DRAFT_323673 [Trichoderma sp. SZMC 28013]